MSEKGWSAERGWDQLADDIADPISPYKPTREDTQRLMEVLNSRLKTVIQWRYGLDGVKRTLKEASQQLGVTAPRVKQLEIDALSRLRRAHKKGTTAMVDGTRLEIARILDSMRAEELQSWRAIGRQLTEDIDHMQCPFCGAYPPAHIHITACPVRRALILLSLYGDWPQHHDSGKQEE